MKRLLTLVVLILFVIDAALQEEYLLLGIYIFVLSQLAVVCFFLGLPKCDKR
ncbi:hypothetical protein [Glaciecola sp. 1036]|uniref:hypothetical protein n=1 Tax=Alteromonadaceae TaxID=72275 RepID=UPI003D088A70